MTYFVVKGINKNGNETQIKATQDGELQVRAIVEPEFEHASANGRAYAWRSNDADIDAGDTLLFVKNTSDKYLLLSHAVFTPSNVACKYDIGIGSATTTPAGNVIVATNPNGVGPITESYLAYDDETAVADTTPIVSVATETVGTLVFDLQGFILGKNQYVQINQETESTSGRVTIFGHFEEELI